MIRRTQRDKLLLIKKMIKAINRSHKMVALVIPIKKQKKPLKNQIQILYNPQLYQ